MSLICKEVIASLEGMKVVAEGRCCELHEYNFELNSWRLLKAGSRPMAPADAEEWVNGWNNVDRGIALSLLT